MLVWTFPFPLVKFAGSISCPQTYGLRLPSGASGGTKDGRPAGLPNTLSYLNFLTLNS
jgi:hypothetical protein